MSTPGRNPFRSSWPGRAPSALSLLAKKQAFGTTNTGNPSNTAFGTFFLPSSTYTLSAAKGTFSYTGSTTNLLKGYKLTSAVGAFTLTGKTAYYHQSALTSWFDSQYQATYLGNTDYVFSNSNKTVKGNDYPFITSYARLGRTIQAGEKVQFEFSWDAFGTTRGAQEIIVTDGKDSLGCPSSSGASGSLIVDDQQNVIGSTSGVTYTGVPFVAGDYLTFNVDATAYPTVGISCSFNGTAVGGDTLTFSGNKDILIGCRLYNLADQVTLRPTAASMSMSLVSGYVALDNLNFYTLTGSVGSFAYTGSTTNFLRGRIMTASTGTYTLTGDAANLLSGRRLIASTGSYTYTGLSANLLVGRKLTASTGNYSLTGITSILRSGRVLSASTGSYTVVGQAASLVSARRLTSSTGAYALTGIAASLVYVTGYRLVASTGTYTSAGTSTGLLKGYRLTCATGMYAATGNTAALVSGRRLTSAVGTFTTTGISALLKRGYVLSSDTGVFTLTGISANLNVGYRLTSNTGSYLLTGGTLTLNRKLTASTCSYTSNGTNAGSVRNYRLTCSTGHYTVFGNDAANPITGSYLLLKRRRRA